MEIKNIFENNDNIYTSEYEISCKFPLLYEEFILLKKHFHIYSEKYLLQKKKKNNDISLLNITKCNDNDDDDDDDDDDPNSTTNTTNTLNDKNINNDNDNNNDGGGDDDESLYKKKENQLRIENIFSLINESQQKIIYKIIDCSIVFFGVFKNDLYNIIYKKSREYEIKDSDIFIHVLQKYEKYKLIKRWSIYTNNIRISIEEQNELQLGSKKNFFLHIEKEYINEIIKEEFLYPTLETCMNKYNLLLDVCKNFDYIFDDIISITYFNRNYTHIQIPFILNKIKEINTRRNYLDITTSSRQPINVINEIKKKYIYISKKIDGIRYLALLTFDLCILIDCKSTLQRIKHNFNFNFNYLAYVEYENNMFYIIDILYLININPDETNFSPISILNSVNYINFLYVNNDYCNTITTTTTTTNTINNKNILKCNFFLTIERSFDNTLNDYFQCYEEYFKNQNLNYSSDGYLIYNEKKILKFKTITTIDLKVFFKDWLKDLLKIKQCFCIKNNIQNLIKGEITLLKKSPLNEILNYFLHEMLNNLLYYNTIKRKNILFKQSFPDFKILLTEKCNIYNLWYLNENNMISDIINQFIILEFNVDMVKKTLIFNKLRDKPNCNTFNYINNILITK
ncbi:hypothetical protein LbFV_ORF107 [Leptopilina boulardi filamentous virus]|uniref:Uncharacterized protein n=1 Tax=Leptopilina boulardi filamentous virus TaxID=552509 RepID=A0A1S5YDF5_9VIRU|nr:hypothetical protein LbFV_ORF107 [Leptopilina boulardi filamentous virus]AQQ80027.1 hypothetical protein LbFV_ORF107 [Leptopilina boulardi filamentous virus]